MGHIASDNTNLSYTRLEQIQHIYRRAVSLYLLSIFSIATLTLEQWLFGHCEGRYAEGSASDTGATCGRLSQYANFNYLFHQGYSARGTDERQKCTPDAVWQ